MSMVRTLGDGRLGIPDIPLIVRAGTALTEISDAFKMLPGLERAHVPRSEYLYSLLRAPLDELLFLGQGYEYYFDELEVIFALIYADLRMDERGGAWGPPGRFTWKHSSGHGTSPYETIVGQAEQQGAAWPPLRAGLFRGDLNRFRAVAKSYKEALDKVQWW
jgi:hypothetical protein